MNEGLIEKIEDALVMGHGFVRGSAITQAVSYVLFNRHGMTLVTNFHRPKALQEAITKEMVSSACEFIIGELRVHLLQLPPPPVQEPTTLAIRCAQFASRGHLATNPRECTPGELADACQFDHLGIKDLVEAGKKALPFLRNHVCMTVSDGPADRIALDKMEAAVANADAR